MTACANEVNYKVMLTKQDLLSALVDAKLCELPEAKGFSAEEISQIQEASGLTLPSQYKEFLSAIGRGAGRFFRGTDMFGSVIPELNQMASELLAENQEPFHLPETAFVFSMHQGYQFDYFDTADAADDPPVYQYVEGKGAPVLTWKSLSEFLRAGIRWHSSMLQAQGAKSSQ